PVGAHIFFAENFDRDLVVCAEDITARGAHSGWKRRRCRRRRGGAATHARNWIGRPDRFSRCHWSRRLGKKRTGCDGHGNQEQAGEHELEGKGGTNSELIIVKTE